MTSLILKEYPISDAHVSKYKKFTFDIKNKLNIIDDSLKLKLGGASGSHIGNINDDDNNGNNNSNNKDKDGKNENKNEIVMRDEEYYIALQLFLKRLVYPKLSFNREGNDKNGINKNTNKNNNIKTNLSNNINMAIILYK